MATVQDCIDGLHVTYPQVQDDQALLYFQQIHHEICNQAQIELDSETHDLVAGTREYALNSTDIMTQVRAAYYRKSATEKTKLVPVSTDWMDGNVPTWRYETATGEPLRFYVEAVESNGEVRVGLDPIPDTTTSGGFPVVSLYGTTFQAMLATENVPTIVSSIRVYIEGMKKLYSSDRDPDRFAIWDELYQRELHNTLAYINNTIEDLDSPRVVPRWMKNTKVQ